MKRMIVGFALVLLCAPAAFAQMPQGHEGHMAGMMPDCAAMMQQKDAMEKHATEMDAKLQGLVDDMNKAKGSAKVDKMAVVVNELIAQRTMMRKQMMEMQPKMMEHMMEHMHGAMMKGMSESMAGCPMMKGDKAPAEATPAH
ncbi:MAG: hypothetical protein ABI837_06245 [Acidobacteriota bacterium]